jgi:hypothetical protein
MDGPPAGGGEAPARRPLFEEEKHELWFGETRLKARRRKAEGGVRLKEWSVAVRSVKDVADRHGMAAIRDVLALVEPYDVETLKEMLEVLETLARDRREEGRSPLNGESAPAPGLLPGSPLEAAR